MEVPSPEVVAGATRRHKRRVIPVVDSRFQWKYTLVVTVLVLGIIALMGSFLYQAHLEHSQLLALEAHPELLEKITQGDRIFLLYLVLMAAAIGVAVMMWGLIVTHRISGPLFVLRRHLNILAAGRYPEIRGLRKSDELEHFYVAFQDAITAMRERDLNRLDRLDEVRNLVIEVQEGIEDDALMNAIELLTNERNALAKSLGPESA